MSISPNRSGAIIGHTISHDGIQLSSGYLDNRILDKLASCSILILRDCYITDIGMCFSLSDASPEITEDIILFAQIWMAEDKRNYFKPIKEAMVRTPVYAGTVLAYDSVLEMAALNQPILVKAGSRLLYVAGIDVSDPSKEITLTTFINGSYAIRQISPDNN